MHTNKVARPASVGSAVAAFALTGLAALLAIWMAVVWVARKDATRAAVEEAKECTVAKGAALVPALSDGILTGDRGALNTLDALVRGRVLSATTVRVKIWSEDGRVLYSDMPQLIGQRFPLGDRERAVLATGNPAARVSNLKEPENLLERPYHKLLEVYDSMQTTGGTPVLFEAYKRFSSVTAQSRRTISSVAPAFLAGLGLLLLIQIPMAWSMARRLERGRHHEKRLLKRAIESGAIERRHIAADLHDGVVQSLAGNALSLAAAAREADRAGLKTVSSTVGTAASEIRQTVRELRNVMVAIAPPRVHETGLATALEDVVSPLQRTGVSTTLRVERMAISRNAEALVYRAVQEAVRNIARHARASHVDVTVDGTEGRIRLVVEDDGIGFVPDETGRRRRNGHMGIPLLAELAEEAGGRLDIQSRPGEGTRIMLEVPVQ
ncbi:MAG TPA: ATP-binding protein [Acidimicrobiales bacterium]|nr:ATP-binding protein [Acidimicrobiales bacterium]